MVQAFSIQGYSRLATFTTFHVVSRWLSKPIQGFFGKKLCFLWAVSRMAGQAGSSPNQGESSRVKLSQAVWRKKRLFISCRVEATRHAEVKRRRERRRFLVLECGARLQTLLAKSKPVGRVN
jgi:hypothetical protein